MMTSFLLKSLITWLGVGTYTEDTVTRSIPIAKAVLGSANRAEPQQVNNII
jgi:hypothetical protein